MSSTTDNNHLPIPKDISEVDRTWLSRAIAAPVAGFEMTQIGQGVGIMGDIFRVALSYEDGSERPQSVVVKLPSSFEENRSQGVALGMFEAEVRFYNELAHRIRAGIPHVYLANIHSGTAEFVIVMEDLSSYTMVEQQTGMTAKQAQAAVRVLAGIHALWWDDVQNPQMEWIPPMTGPRIAFVDEILPGVFPTFIDGFRDYLPPGGLEIFTAFVGNYMKINTVLAQRSPWTLAHQDFRVENLMFNTEVDESVVVLDWQGIGRGPGAYDLAYLLGGSMTTELRRAHEWELVAAYHEKLQASGITGYSLQQCREDYALAHLMGGLATPVLIGGAMDLSNERGVSLVATMAARHASAALDHDGMKRLQEILIR